MGPSMAVEGATTARVFETYVERVLTCAATSKVQRLESLPNSLGERCSNSRKASACSRPWKAL